MNRKFKMLSMALVVVLALTAVSVSAASAAKYTASSYPATGTGTSALGNDTLRTEAGVLECASHFEGSLTAASDQLTIKATYTGCRAFGFINATVSMGTCDYLFTTPTAVVSNKSSASADVKCTKTESEPKAVDPIKIVVSTCELEIGEQNPGGSVAITNETAAGDVKIQASMTGINYTVTKDGLGCPFSGAGAKTGATLLQDNAITFDVVSPSAGTIDVG